MKKVLVLLICLLFISGCFKENKSDIIKSNMNNLNNYSIEIKKDMSYISYDKIVNDNLKLKYDIDCLSNTSILNIDDDIIYLKNNDNETISYIKNNDIWNKYKEDKLDGIHIINKIKNIIEIRSNDPNYYEFKGLINGSDVLNLLKNIGDAYSDNIDDLIDIKIKANKDYYITNISIDLSGKVYSKTSSIVISNLIIIFNYSNYNRLDNIIIPQNVIENALEI